MNESSPASADWQQVKALFDEVLALAPAQRHKFLLEITADAAVRREVLSLLSHAEAAEAEGALEPDRTPSVESVTRNAPEGGSVEGQRLGPWTLVGRLGQGGMGDVYRARRGDGAFEGEAAIKVLKRGMDSEALLARFAQEQRALARLNHPHIARLFDAGLTPDQRPYFVMELVDGRPIDRAVEGLALEARLALFLQLADAVAYAHRQLLVHRDLKPGNVLVDREGRVKLLDFGIAKALEPDADSLTTQQGERPFTPHYASPEQVRGEPVSTATDLYSLGVLLYVLLTGQRPYGRHATTPQAAARCVLEEAPTRPSSLSPGLGADPQWLATRRRLVGDLDNILLKVLEKPVERRYASVDALAADIQAFLDGYPVSARPASVGYLLGKFVGRNRWAVLAGTLGGLGLATGLAAALLQGRAAAALGAVGLAGGLGIALVQGRQAMLARDLAQKRLAQITRVTTEIVFRYGDTVTTLPGGAKAQIPLLERTLLSIEQVLVEAPDDIELRSVAATVLARLAELGGGAQLNSPEQVNRFKATTARAVTLGETLWPARRGDWRFASWHARALYVQGSTQRTEGQLEAALTSTLRMAERGEEALALQAGNAEACAYLLTSIANARLLASQILDHTNAPSLGRPGDALVANRDAERRFRELLADKALLDALDAAAVPGDPSTEVYLRHQIGTLIGGRALIHLRHEELPAMRAEAEAAMVLRRANVEREPKNLAWRDGLIAEANTLAIALIRLSDMPAALAATELAWRTAEELAAEEGPQSKWAGIKPILAAQHGRALAGQGRHAEAIAVFDLGLARWNAALVQGPDPNATRRVAWHEVQRARSMAALGQRAPATTLAAEASARLHTLTADPNVGRDALLALAEAEALLARLDTSRAAEHRDAARCALQDAQALNRLGADHERLLASLG